MQAVQHQPISTIFLTALRQARLMRRGQSINAGLQRELVQQATAAARQERRSCLPVAHLLTPSQRIKQGAEGQLNAGAG